MVLTGLPECRAGDGTGNDLVVPLVPAAAGSGHGPRRGSGMGLAAKCPGSWSGGSAAPYGDDFSVSPRRGAPPEPVFAGAFGLTETRFRC
ncbi:hypothetical protein GCM10010187_71570 [Actinomadura coerulea]|nr:hypothetical protein GCM10010187_71570 [Actinomadura coerulea]